MDAPQNITTAIVGPNIELSWDSVASATSYRIYGSDDPYGTFTNIGTSGTTTWDQPYDDSKKFYYVVAVNGVK